MNRCPRSYRFVPLSNVQKGAIGQFAFLAAAMFTANGQLEVYIPAADNEGRDAEVRRHLRGLAAVGVQIKVAFSLIGDNSPKQTYLGIRFRIPKYKVQHDPRLVFFFAVYDRKRLGFYDPVFLVPAAVFYKLGRRGVKDGQVWFEIMANLAPNSHDQWSPYRVALKDLGKRLLETIDSQRLPAGNGVRELPSDTVLVTHRRRRVGNRRVLCAA
jgi:hypothetical protein